MLELDLICHNSRIYNGDDNDLTITAKKLVEKLKVEIKRTLNQSKTRKEEGVNGQLPGKLTAPPRAERYQTSFDQFMQAQEEPNNLLQTNMGRQRAQIEEVKNEDDKDTNYKISLDLKKSEEEADLLEIYGYEEGDSELKIVGKLDSLNEYEEEKPSRKPKRLRRKASKEHMSEEEYEGVQEEDMKDEVLPEKIIGKRLTRQ